MKIEISIVRAPWHTLQRELLEVRCEVFVVEQGVPEEIEVDEHDPLSEHFLAIRDDGAPIGTARLLPSGRVGRVAVLAEWRRRGIGRLLMETALVFARERGDTRLVLHAQVESIPFYESLGFSILGPEFEEAGIPHREMELHLATARREA